MEWLSKSTKTRGADKYDKVSKHGRNEAQIHEKSGPELNKKRCLKTDAKKSKNTQKMTPTSVPRDEFISGVVPLGTPVVALTALGHQKLAPSALKVPPMIKKSTKNNTKEPPDCEKELPNSSFLGTWPGGLREALTINF